MATAPAPTRFLAGDAVEVLSRFPPRRGGWYAAVIYSPAVSNHYTVKFPDGTIESVRAGRIRYPAPHLRQHCPFVLNQAVEVSYRGGWWPGVVVDVKHEKVGGRQRVKEYIVKGVGERIVCRLKDMRKAEKGFEGETPGVAGNRRVSSIPGESSIKKRRISDIMPAAQGRSVVDLQGNTLVSKPSVGVLSTVTNKLSTQGGTEQKSPTSTPRVGTSGGIVTPLYNELLDSEAIASILVNMTTVQSHSTQRTEVEIHGDTNSLEEHGLSNMTAGDPNSTPRAADMTGGTNHQNDEDGTNHVGLNSTPRAADITGEVTPLSNELQTPVTLLPFEKSSPMWKYIDQEVMPNMRRYPHFQPLEQAPLVQREGTALGLVVTYKNLISGKGGLKMDLLCDNLEENIKTTSDLEKHGFDVQHIKPCLEKLQRLKSNHKQLLQRRAALEEQASDMKLNHLNAELEETNKAFMALKRALDLFDERKTSLSIQKEKCETASAEVQKDLRLVVEELASSEQTLQDLLAAVRYTC